jgi:hypothetical protein
VGDAAIPPPEAEYHVVDTVSKPSDPEVLLAWEAALAAHPGQPVIGRIHGAEVLSRLTNMRVDWLYLSSDGTPVFPTSQHIKFSLSPRAISAMFPTGRYYYKALPQGKAGAAVRSICYWWYHNFDVFARFPGFRFNLKKKFQGYDTLKIVTTVGDLVI